MIKEGQIRKSYYILAIPKGLQGEDNLCLLAWGGPYSKAAEECAKFEKDGFHHFKVLRTIDVNEKTEKDYQHFWANYMGTDGKAKMVFSTEIFDDMESGVLSLTIYRDKTYKENKQVDGKLVPDFYPESEVELDSCYYLKPSVLKAFMDLLTSLDLKNWENKHWGSPIYNLYYALKDDQSDDMLRFHKFYVAPEREIYNKFIKGIQQLCLESLTPTAYKKFVNSFDTTRYSKYYRAGLPLAQSQKIFKVVEEEMNAIKNKSFDY